MIEPGRTNAIPRTLIILCIGLFVMRAAAVFYGTFFQKAPTSLISWQEPTPIDKSRRDLLSKPYLYFFLQNGDQLHSITGQVFENMLFHNREVARLITREFNPVKVALNDKVDGVQKSLSSSFTNYGYPAVYIALPNGKKIQHTSWQSDRMFHAFLREALINSVSTAAVEAMKSADWAVANQAYDRASRHQHLSSYANRDNAIYWSIALRHLGNETRAREVLEAQRSKRRLPRFIADKGDWPVPCAEYLLGNISRDELMKTAIAEGDSYGYKGILVHYVCGADLLLRGKKEEAIKELKIAAMKGKSSYLYPVGFASAELQAIGEKVPKVDKEDDDISNF